MQLIATSNGLDSAQIGRLPLKNQLTIQSAEGMSAGLKTPSWAGFMVFLGWWISNLPQVDGVIHCVVKVPTRSCCAPLVALGALLRSAAEAQRALTWEELVSLPDGTRAYLQISSGKGRPKVQSGLIYPSGSEFGGSVRVEVDEPRHVHWITPPTFSKFQVRVTPPANSRRSTVQGEFLRGVVPDFSNEWLHMPFPCCSVLTNQSRWRAEASAIILRAGGHSVPLSQLLSPAEGEAPPRVVVRSQRIRDELRQATVILDGATAFAFRDRVAADRIITLVTALEFGVVKSEVLTAIAARKDELLKDIGPFPATSFETALFASHR